MTENVALTRAKAAQTVIKGLNRRNMSGEYCATAAQALEAAKRYLVPGTSVAWGGTTTLAEIGFLDAIRASDCKVLDRYAATTPEEQRAIYKEIAFCDTYFMSTNAITMDGVLVNIDGNANRVSALAFGPQKVVIVAGMNKVTVDLDSAIKRARNVAAPINATRFGLSTPCTELGRCGNCQNEQCICCEILVTRRSKHDGRIHVILVGEDLGY